MPDDVSEREITDVKRSYGVPAWRSQISITHQNTAIMLHEDDHDTSRIQNRKHAQQFFRARGLSNLGHILRCDCIARAHIRCSEDHIALAQHTGLEETRGSRVRFEKRHFFDAHAHTARITSFVYDSLCASPDNMCSMAQVVHPFVCSCLRNVLHASLATVHSQGILVNVPPRSSNRCVTNNNGQCDQRRLTRRHHFWRRGSEDYDRQYQNTAKGDAQFPGGGAEQTVVRL